MAVDTTSAVLTLPCVVGKEEYRVAMDEMKIQAPNLPCSETWCCIHIQIIQYIGARFVQVSKGNDHYTKLQQFEEDW